MTTTTTNPNLRPIASACSGILAEVDLGGGITALQLDVADGPTRGWVWITADGPDTYVVGFYPATGDHTDSGVTLEATTVDEVLEGIVAVTRRDAAQRYVDGLADITDARVFGLAFCDVHGGTLVLR